MLWPRRSHREAAQAVDSEWYRQPAVVLGGVSVVLVVALWVTGRGWQELGSVTGALHSLGRPTALLSSLLLLAQVLLVTRVPSPILNAEAVAEQSADVDLVLGATLTSQGYLQFLQSAIDGASA